MVEQKIYPTLTKQTKKQTRKHCNCVVFFAKIEYTYRVDIPVVGDIVGASLGFELGAPDGL